jgi:YhcG PDDEXK nuclease domain
MLESADCAESSDAITAEETVKDPFVLEFLGLRDEYSESDLEEALIHNLTDFLLELGDDSHFWDDKRGFVSMTLGSYRSPLLSPPPAVFGRHRSQVANSATPMPGRCIYISITPASIG